jgi:hypothetical protein
LEIRWPSYFGGSRIIKRVANEWVNFDEKTGRLAAAILAMSEEGGSLHR